MGKKRAKGQGRPDILPARKRTYEHSEKPKPQYFRNMNGKEVLKEVKSGKE